MTAALKEIFVNAVLLFYGICVLYEVWRWVFGA